MISNIQQQQRHQYDSAMMEKILSSPVVVVDNNYVNNNNNNNNTMNKDIHIASLIPNQPNADIIIFDPSVDYYDDDDSSVNTKEIITVASQQSYETVPTILTQQPPNSSTVVAITTMNHGNQSIPLRLELNGSSNGERIQNAISHEYAFNVDRNAIDDQQPPPPLQRSVSSLATPKTSNRVPEQNHRLVQQQNYTEALRCIEDVHNYSKINRFDDSSNSSSPEEDDDDVDDDDDDDDNDDIDEDIMGDDDVFKASSIITATTFERKTQLSSPLKIQIDDNPKILSQQRNYAERPSSLGEITNLSLNSSHQQKMVTINHSTLDSPLKNTAAAAAATTSSSFEIADDEMDSGGGGGTADKTAPDHHARRPMNAFLIFCKRHRAIVRDKYKHLENRQITKILGEWWATLSNSEKACYTDLAKQYKDAFFKANPNFKWYKLPAPPLRTCSIRPGHHHHHHDDHHHHNEHSPQNSDDYGSPTFNGELNHGGIDRFSCDNECIRKSISEHNPYKISSPKSTAVGVFKLADEAQMGGLSSLISSACTNHNGTSSNSNSPNVQISSENYDNKSSELTPRTVLPQNALQDALNETSNFLLRTILPSSGDNHQIADAVEPFQNMRNHAIRMENDHPHPMNGASGKRKSPDSYRDMTSKKPYSPPPALSSLSDPNDDVFPKKSARSCKGKKYMELMYSGQITSFGKKGSAKNRSTTISASLQPNGICSRCPENVSIVTDGYEHQSNPYSSPIKLQKSESIISLDRSPIDAAHHSGGSSEQPQHSPQLDSPSKQFDASDFDLEEKIKALPAQCLDSYLLRKRETKKKKKIGSKRRQTSTPSKSRSSGQQQQLLQQQQQQQHQQRSPLTTLPPPPMPQTIQEARERMQNAMVGSQKRKARKESITRRDIHAMNSSSSPPTELLSKSATANCLLDLVKLEFEPTNGSGGGGQVDGMVIIKQEPEFILPDFANKAMTTAPNATTSDLLILAEVATNHITDKVDNLIQIKAETKF